MTSPITSQDNDLDGAIAIIGMALRVPGAATPDAFWQNLRDGVCSLTRFTPDELRKAGVPEADFTRPDYVSAGGVLPDVDRFDAAFFGFTAREAACLPPQNRLLFECCWEAMEQAGYDPKGTTGRTGLFFGQSADSYWRHNVEPNLSALDTGLDFFSNADFLSTGIAYKLDLRGPALTVQSFCSTSLLAVHLARQSLLEGECDMALAGGASVRVPQAQGYVHTPESIYSPDGVVRAFDAGANGTLFSNSVGAVLLKRLDDALADGDRIDAVIRGSAANNDGNRKAGYNAPSVEGQARVVVQALRDAGVSADDISYVECHGTGTRVGDPIEIAALTKAFRVFTQRSRYCAVGSAKPNIGHADRASGVVSLIKTALSLRHRTLPRLPNFQTPNPAIDFDGSPFYVGDQTRPWPSGSSPRRAGVTSLGYGGTNVHLVLEEAPEPSPAPAHLPQAQLITLSARSAAALDATARQLADHLERHPDVALDGVAHTLQAGRHGFNHRRVVVGSSAGEIVRQLRAPGRDSVAEIRNPPVHFVFSETPLDRAMAKAAYRSDSALRRLLDEGRATPFEDDLDRLPDATIRLLFDRALARTWMSRGIKPASLRGSGTGQLTAACVAGAISVEDALNSLATGIQPPLKPADLALLHPDAPVDPPGLRLDIDVCDDAGLARTMGALWLAGVEPDWQAVHGGATPPQRLALPTYPFERESHWLDVPVVKTAPVPAAEEAAPGLHVPSWRRLAPRTSSAGAACRILVLDRNRTGEGLAIALERQGDTVIRVVAGDRVDALSESCYTVDATRPEQLDRLLTRLKIWQPVSLILCADPTGETVPDRALAGFLEAHRWLRAVDGAGPGAPANIQIMATGLFQVTGTDPIRPELAPLPALLAVAAQEYPRLSFRIIDAGASACIDAVAAELRMPALPASPSRLALRGGQRWAPATEPLTPEGEDLAGRLRQGGVYLITGGLGGIGYTLARHLAETVQARLVLLSRDIPAPGSTGPRAGRLATLQQRGGDLLTLSVDVGSQAQLARAVEQARTRFGRIDGVIHAAGLPGAATLDRLTDDQVHGVMTAKVAGACTLIDLLRDDPPDFLILCSSLAAEAPAVGQAHYAAANAVLDALAQQPDQPVPVISVNWNSWRTVGMAQDVWNRAAEATAIDHGVFTQSLRMPDGEIRYHANLDPERDWVLAEHRLFGRPTLPGTGIIELALSAFLHSQGGFRPVELRDVALVRPLSVSGTSADIRVSLIPGNDGTHFRVESVVPDTAPILHGQGSLHLLHARPMPVPTTPGSSTRPLPDQPGSELYLGPRWNCLTRVTGSDDGFTIAELTLASPFHGDLADGVLHPALLDIATSVHARAAMPDTLLVPVGYRSLRVHQPLGSDVISITRHPGIRNDATSRWDLTLADRQGTVLVEIDGFTLSPPDAVGATGATAARPATGNPFEADSITPEEGIAIFRRIPVGSAPQLMVSRARTTASVTTVALPASPAIGSRSGDTDVHAAIAALWQRILGGPLPAHDASFFELGGNSLGATRLLAYLRETYGIAMDIRSFFADPTIKALASRIEAAAATATPDDDREEGTL